MKVQVIYSSKSGGTKKVANAIFNGIDVEQKTIHDLKDGAPALDGDIILLGYWVNEGGPNDEMKQFMQTVKGKAVGVFCTLGYYADSAYAHQTVAAGLKLVQDNNDIIGTYVCNGATSHEPMDAGYIPTEQKQLRWELLDNHPTVAECALGAERFNERIKHYARCKEFNIDFTSIV